MKTKLTFENVSSLSTELLVLVAADASTSKEKNALAQPVLLTKDSAITSADKPVLTSGEFSAGLCETLLLYAPPELKAKRLLIIGVGKAAKISLHDIRKAAGAAVRFAKPRSIREAGAGACRSRQISLPLHGACRHRRRHRRRLRFRHLSLRPQGPQHRDVYAVAPDRRDKAAYRIRRSAKA